MDSGGVISGQISLIAVLFLALVAVCAPGCSSQPPTLRQELEHAAVGAVAGGLAGALVGTATHRSIPLAAFIGAAGVAATILLFDETRREAIAPTPDSGGE